MSLGKGQSTAIVKANSGSVHLGKEGLPVGRIKDLVTNPNRLKAALLAQAANDKRQISTHSKDYDYNFALWTIINSKDNSTVHYYVEDAEKAGLKAGLRTEELNADLTIALNEGNKLRELKPKESIRARYEKAIKDYLEPPLIGVSEKSYLEGVRTAGIEAGIEETELERTISNLKRKKAKRVYHTELQKLKKGMEALSERIPVLGDAKAQYDSVEERRNILLFYAKAIGIPEAKAKEDFEQALETRMQSSKIK